MFPKDLFLKVYHNKTILHEQGKQHILHIIIIVTKLNIHIGKELRGKRNKGKEAFTNKNILSRS